MKTITTRQLLDATGFTSVRTLQRWRKLGLVPPPSLQRHPTGKGMTWIWPVWVVKHVNAIRERLANGETLEDIRATLSGNWPAEAKKHARVRYDFAAAHARMLRDEATDSFAEWVADNVYTFLQKIGVERPGGVYGTLHRAVVKPQFIAQISQALREGCNPVLLVSETGVDIAPDFMLGASLENQPLLVLPIREAFIKAFAEAEPDLPKAVTYAPAMLLTEQTSKKRRTRKYQVTGRSEIALEK